MENSKKPSKKETCEFWERCGFEMVHHNDIPFAIKYAMFGTQRFDKLPPIDLNNLFKYAVPNPKIKTVMLCHHFSYESGLPERDGYEANVMWDTMDNVCVFTDEDPALALFWALDKVRLNEALL